MLRINAKTRDPNKDFSFTLGQVRRPDHAVITNHLTRIMPEFTVGENGSGGAACSRST
jgi:hypothetical protein